MNSESNVAQLLSDLPEKIGDDNQGTIFHAKDDDGFSATIFVSPNKTEEEKERNRKLFEQVDWENPDWLNKGDSWPVGKFNQKTGQMESYAWINADGTITDHPNGSKSQESTSD